MTTRDTAIAEFTRALAARSATPGGGAAAAVTAAIGCSAGAMAARYTTGPKWGAASDHALSLAEALDRATQAALTLADDDAAAFTAVQQARKNNQTEALARAEYAAVRVPTDVIKLCVEQAAALAAFLPTCNPQLRSDVAVALRLLAGAGRAAWETLLVNKPDAPTIASAKKQLADLQRYDDTANAMTSEA